MSTVLTGVVLGLDWATRATARWRLESPAFMHGEGQKPAHEVVVEAFSMGQYPVTFEEYDTFCEATGRELPHDGGWGRGERPVIGVSWEDAAAYCEWLSRQTRAPYRLAYGSRMGICLPVGWRCVLLLRGRRSETGRVRLVGGNTERQTHPVGEKRANDWHLYDMHGNVWEWVQDWYAGDYYGRSPRENPTGPEPAMAGQIASSPWRLVAQAKAVRGFTVGIPEYRIVNLYEQQVVVYRQPTVDATAPYGRHCDDGFAIEGERIPLGARYRGDRACH